MCYSRRLTFISILSLFFVLSCVNQKISISSNNDSRKYFEDLSFIRESENVSNSTNDEENIVGDKNNLGIDIDYCGFFYVGLIIDKKNNLGIDIELDSILKIIKSEVDEEIFTDGYTIQIYLGDKREEAENTVEKLFEYDSLIKSNTIFTQPNYRVKTGTIEDRFKANYEYKKLKKTFPNAIIIPEKIKIN